MPGAQPPQVSQQFQGKCALSWGTEIHAVVAALRNALHRSCTHACGMCSCTAAARIRIVDQGSDEVFTDSTGVLTPVRTGLPHYRVRFYYPR